ncbi:ribosomal-protein-alanine N-acetyltransferase [Peribacillus deserti]|uniref:Ribosomal-protein-alanine N-acetyltransferase n=1 Tax=Peribacillus deserti TaxID=673318 RepID=A0ABS2QLI5_9BACI|nr:GNAT family protein [Peribacillus deserti]MBM7693870.1 ribosomal-protein-alanine N-acetyltransferase [Peribacillus deserti]
MLRGKRIYLRPLEETDAEGYTNLLVRNRHVWQDYEPARDNKYYTQENQRKSILESKEDFINGKSYIFGVFLIENDELVGEISLYNVKGGFFQTASAGYSMDTDQTGKGLATEGLSLLIRFAFETIKLRRIEAGVSPENTASIRVLEKAGFQKEGLMRENLLINGEWKNHFLYAVLSTDKK